MTIEVPTEKLIMGLDSSRRVGWAKAYEEAEGREIDKRLALHRLGLVLGVLDICTEHGLAAHEARALASLFIEDTVDVDADRTAIADGRFASGVVLRERWGTVEEAITAANVTRSKPKAPTRKKKSARKANDRPGSVRCGECRRLLGVLQHMIFTTRCQRCKTMTSAPLAPEQETAA